MKDPISTCTIYIDEAGDLGFNRGTKWFVLSAAIVKKEDEPSIRLKLSDIKNRLNVKEIHLRVINDFYRRAYIVKEINSEQFTYINVIMDTEKMGNSKIKTAPVAYNYMCRMLLERVSWYLRDHNLIGDIVLSSRGTSKDAELIAYIKDKLLPYPDNRIYDYFNKVIAKSSGAWDLLQLADICATTTFLAYEVNTWGYRTLCYMSALKNHLYNYGNKIEGYGVKYFANDMKPSKEEMDKTRLCNMK